MTYPKYILDCTQIYDDDHMTPSTVCYEVCVNNKQRKPVWILFWFLAGRDFLRNLHFKSDLQG